MDLAPDPGINGASYANCDILDFAALSRQVEGCDAIAHLAAIPSTMSHPNADLFSINVAGTYNLFEAAERAGVKRIAQASSINAFGGYWGCDDREYDYFPLDEDHPPHTTDAYSFSKQMVEEIAAYYQRRAGIDSVSFRLPAVWGESVIRDGKLRESLARKRQQFDAFFSHRAPNENSASPEPAPDRWRCAAAACWNMRPCRLASSTAIRRKTGSSIRISSTASIIGRSFTRTIRPRRSKRALAADFQGAHALFVNSDLNYLNYDSEALLSVFFPDARRRAKSIQGAGALVSIERVRDLIGFEPTVRTII